MEFWQRLVIWLRDNGIHISALKESDLIFGKYDITDDFTLINHILLWGKFYLYYSRCQRTVLPNLSCFIARTDKLEPTNDQLLTSVAS